jgi:T5SS/PEP-CTERM-associated repeat protein
LLVLWINPNPTREHMKKLTALIYFGIFSGYLPLFGNYIDIYEDTTYSGETLESPGSFLYVDDPSDPLLTLSNGSSWTQLEEMWILQGRLSILSGSFLESYSSNIYGTVTVSGIGSRLETEGIEGLGNLHILDEGTVSVNGHLDNYGGTLTLDGGTLTVRGIENIHSLDFRSGTLVNTGAITGNIWVNSWDDPSRVIIRGKDAFVTGQIDVTELRVEDGGLLTTDSGYIGNDSSVTVTGEGSIWVDSGELDIGTWGGGGELTIENGGSVFSAAGYIGQDGFVSVTGSESQWSSGELSVNHGGGLSITNGGTVWVEDTVWMNGYVTLDGGTFTVGGLDNLSNLNFVSGTLVSTGYINGNITPSLDSNRTVIIRGKDAQWNAFDLLVGEGVESWGTRIDELAITDGGSVYSETSNITSEGRVLVTGKDSVWINHGELSIESSEAGGLTITNGGSVSNTTGRIGTQLNSHGIVTVTGTGSIWNNSGSLFVGGSHSSTRGTLIVENGGEVWSNSLQISNTGTVILDGGTIRFDGYNRQGSGMFDYRSGTIQLVGSRAVGGDATINSLFGSHPVLTSGKGLKIEGSVMLQETFTLAGGTFGFSQIVNPENLYYQSGTIFLFGNRTVGDDAAITAIYGSNPILTSGMGLIVEGGLSLNETITLAGGTLGFNSINSQGNLNYQSGTIFLSGNREVSSDTTSLYTNQAIGSGFGLTIEGQAALQTNLTLDGGTLTVGGMEDVHNLDFRSGTLVNTGTITEEIMVNASGDPNSIIIRGKDAVWENPAEIFYVGEYSNGPTELRVEAGGFVSNVSSHVGCESRGTATVTVTGEKSTWENSDELRIGGGWVGGELTVSDGGSVLSETGHIDYNGTVAVTGNGSQWNSGDLYVNDEGKLSITNGGTVWVEDTFEIDGGHVTLDGGTLRLDHYSFLGGTLDYLSGTIQFAGNRNVGTDTSIAAIYGASPVLMEGKGLKVEGTVTLDETVTLAGGTLGFNQIVNPENLDYQSGTIFLFGNRTVGTDAAITAIYGANPTIGNGFGLTIEGQATLQNSLTLNGGTLTVGGLANVSNLNFLSGTLVNTGTISGNIGPFSSFGGIVVIQGKDALWEGTFGGVRLGELIVTDGGRVSGATATIGLSGGGSGSIREITVMGTGSTWDHSGTVNISNAGKLTVTDGGIWNNAGEVRVSSNGQLLIADGGRVFNTTGWMNHVPPYFLGYSAGVTVSGVGSSWNNSSQLTVGYSSGGNLTIQNGGSVFSETGTIGAQSGSYGNVLVTGAGSVWSNPGALHVGQSGVGWLTISDGGRVSSGESYISSRGVVAVTGADSRWYSNSNIHNSGMLTISDGGLVIVSETLRNNGRITLEVSNSGMLQVGQMGNDGLVRLVATPNLVAGTYTPIASQGWYGHGTYETIGGIWDNGTHQFTVAAAQNTSSGNQSTVDLSSTQRLEIIGSAGQVMLAFNPNAEATGGGSSILFLGTENNATQIGGQNVLSAWDFETDLAPGTDVQLYFDIGMGWDTSSLLAWYSTDGLVWTAFETDIFYDGKFASFTVEGFSSYALTAVPEPATFVLLIGLGFLGWVFVRRRLGRGIGKSTQLLSA